MSRIPHPLCCSLFCCQYLATEEDVLRPCMREGLRRALLRSLREWRLRALREGRLHRARRRGSLGMPLSPGRRPIGAWLVEALRLRMLGG